VLRGQQTYELNMGLNSSPNWPVRWYEHSSQGGLGGVSYLL